SQPREQLSISFKPSMFSVNPAGSDEAYRRIEKIVDYAKNAGIRATIESEDHNWTDFQLSTYFALVNKGYTNVGTVLQSRLLRTRKDIEKFDDKMRVRLVIGIYNELPEFAHTDKRAMKELLVQYSAELMNRGSYVEFATHDAHYIRKFVMNA